MFRKLLLAIACLAPAAAHADWQEGSSQHFLVYSDDSPANVKAMTARLERFDRAVRFALALKDPEVGPDARVVVFVLPTAADVDKMMGAHMGAAGYYSADSPAGPFAFVPKNSSGESEHSLSPRMTLQHEYTHHLMYSNWGDVVFPMWFSEGFAELFATARVKDDGSVAIGAFPEYRAYGISQMNMFPTEKLLTTGPNYRNPMEAQVFYGRSWLLTDFLMFDPERSKQLAAYIVAINEGKSASEAAAVLGATATLDMKMNNYLARKLLPIKTLPAKDLPIGEVTTRALTPGEAAVMPALMRSHHGVDAQQAQEVVVEARRLAALYPNDAGAQNELAEAENDAGNYALSEAAADRALAANPKSVHALIYKGMAQIAIAKKADNKDPAVWTTARRWFLAANRADPLYSFPPQLYYESFLAAKQAPSRAARDGLLYAYKLAPQPIGLRLEAATVLLQDGNAKAARIAIEPMAYSEHPSPLVDQAKKALAALDSGGASAALAVFDEARAKEDADKANAKAGKKD
jgi:tetratricopeptide (TPR) repeat protein